MAPVEQSLDSPRRPMVEDASSSSIGITLREFLRHPLQVGSAFPASRRLVRRLMEPVPWGAMGLCVEYGPGSGIFTREILPRLPRDGVMLAVDSSEEFTRHLKREIDDPRLHAVTGTAQEIEQILSRLGLGRPDLILSGLPFSTLAREEAAAMMATSARLLRPGGHFLAYQMRSAIRPYLGRHFARVREGYEWWNIPPCHLYWAARPFR